MAEVSRNLYADEEKVFFRLRGLVGNKARRNSMRVEYFDMKNKLDKIGFSVPEFMQDLQAAMGWPYKAVAVPARRIRPEGFSLVGVAGAGASLLGELEAARVDGGIASAERMAVESMMLHSAAFLFASPGDPERGEPRVVTSVCTALEATAEVDKRTRRVTSALEIVSKTECLLYLPGLTLRVQMLNPGRWTVTAEYVGVKGRVMCTPYVWRKSLSRPFGYSRITRGVIGLTNRFIRANLREEVNAEFFSAPRMAMTNADESAFFDENGKEISPLKAMMGAVWGIPAWRDDETGDLVEPSLQQFSQASFEPHQAMKRGIAMEFSGETDIPVGQLGIVQDNPSSADAIRAAEYGMIALIESELPSLAEMREDFARNVLMVLHGEWSPGMEKDLRGLRAHFADPGTPTRSAQADAGSKTITAIPDIVGSGVELELLGLSHGQIEQVEAHRLKVGSGDLIDKLLGSPAAAGGAPENPALAEALVVKAKADALGVLRRAGVERNAAAAQAGFDGGLTFIEGEPITIKTKDE